MSAVCEMCAGWGFFEAYNYDFDFDIYRCAGCNGRVEPPERRGERQYGWHGRRCVSFERPLSGWPDGVDSVVETGVDGEGRLQIGRAHV